MADHISVRPAKGTWVVRAGGAVIGESDKALELSDGDYPAVIYFPRGDIAMEFLDDTEKVTHSPHIGDANHFSIVTKSTVLENAAWTYQSPNSGVSEIADHVAFYASEKVAVEQV